MACKFMSCECGKRYLPQRYFLVAMLCLAITLCYNHRVSLNLVINSMVKPSSTNTTMTTYCPKDPVENKTIQGDLREWDSITQGYVKLTFYIGYVLLHIPGGILADIIGGRITILIATIVSTICCFLTPLSVFLGDWWLLCIMRVIMGCGQGILYPAVSNLLAKWIPKNQRSLLSAFAFSGSHVGTILGNVCSGFIVDLLNSWPMVFYIWAILTVPWILIAFFWVFSMPQTHPFITEKEKTYLEEEIPVKAGNSIPWKDICKDMRVWGIVIGQIAHSWMFFTLNTDLPNFLKNVQGFDIKANGVLSAMPFLAMWIASLIAGKVADVLIQKGVRVITVRRGATIIGNIIASAFLLFVPFMGCNRYLVMTIFIGTMILIAPYYCGIRINNLDLSVHFAGILTAIINGLGSISGILTPYIIGWVAQDQTIEQWRIVYFINFAVTTSLTIVNIIFTAGERAEWDLRYDEVKIED